MAVLKNSLFNFGFTHFVYAEEPNIINVVTFDEPRISDPKINELISKHKPI